ncbi:hypothetical protein ACFQJ5_02130 [Halomicroarcula sp. GCM10025324]|uniref:hypothetical protein n=1 Tax=Haloarcula TaxID=2237 RepID=UPI0023E76E26|nr:hypothetical protein [Halomicroarcula sp. ZS-22-S1]
MRHVPSPNADARALRPLIAVLLGALLVVTGFLFTTGGAAPSDQPVSVTVTAAPVDSVPADATVHRHDDFEFASPVHRAVTKADDAGPVTMNATVEAPSAVRLPDGADRTRYYVRSDLQLTPADALFRVTVETSD